MGRFHLCSESLCCWSVAMVTECCNNAGCGILLKHAPLRGVTSFSWLDTHSCVRATQAEGRGWKQVGVAARCAYEYPSPAHTQTESCWREEGERERERERERKGEGYEDSKIGMGPRQFFLCADPTNWPPQSTKVHLVAMVAVKHAMPCTCRHTLAKTVLSFWSLLSSHSSHHWSGRAAKGTLCTF